MLTLLGSFLGLLGSFVPEIIKHFRDVSDKAHELEILDRQILMMKESHRGDLERMDAIGDMQESRALYHHARLTRVPWVDALGGTVRPVITYVFFLLYASVKGATFCIIQKTEGALEALGFLWHPEDQALFAAVMSFWFGQRALLKFRRLK